MTTAAVGRRALAAPSRIAGVDLARGLAVLGMLTAHLWTTEAFDVTRPETWVDLVNGRSSILFAVLAGVSLALASGGANPVGGVMLRVFQRRRAVRAAVIWAIGVLLLLTGVPVYVILPAYALLFLLSLPLLGLRARTLWAIAGVLAVIMPWVQVPLNALPIWSEPAGETIAPLIGWHYPFPLWMTFVVAGLAIGRSGMTERRTLVALVGGGSAAVLVGYGAVALFPATGDDPWLTAVWTAAPHSGGLPEVIGSGGFAVALIGAAVALCRTPVSRVLFPLRAVGAMPLTAYAGQIVVWAIAAVILVGDSGDLLAFRGEGPLVPFLLGTIVFCTAWAWWLGRGPLERLVAWITRRIVPGPVGPA